MSDSQILVPFTEYNMSKVQVGQIIRIPLYSFVPLGQAREISLEAQIAAADFSGTGTNPTLQFAIVPSVPSSDSKMYQDVNTVLASASWGAATVPTAPSLKFGSNISGGTTTPVGRSGNLYMVYTQYGTTCTSASFTVQISLARKP